MKTRDGQREINGIKILLPGTESTGFSRVGSLTGQIIEGLREQQKGVTTDDPDEQ